MEFLTSANLRGGSALSSHVITSHLIPSYKNTLDVIRSSVLSSVCAGFCLSRVSCCAVWLCVWQSSISISGRRRFHLLLLSSAWRRALWRGINPKYVFHCLWLRVLLSFCVGGGRRPGKTFSDGKKTPLPLYRWQSLLFLWTCWVVILF